MHFVFHKLKYMSTPLLIDIVMPFVSITFIVTTSASSFVWFNYLLLFGLTIKTESYIMITPKMTKFHKSQYNTFIRLSKLR
jgi:hypothetical protein